MPSLRRIVLVRHGETDGESSIRFHGTTDVALAPEGREQMKAVARQLRFESFDGLFSSPLRRAWGAAWIVGGGSEISLVPQFREVDFGRWEGLTRDEIEARDPVLAKDWQDGAEGFEYPGGESRSDFRARVESGLDALLASGLRSVLVVAHKGVIRAIGEKLTGEVLDREAPPLGGVVVLTRDVDGSWFVGQRGSNPPALAEQA